MKTCSTHLEIEFFGSPSELRRWFEKNYNKKQEQYIGFYRIDSGKQSITYQEALDEALCFGWIDGVRKRLDEEKYMIRFTPRKPNSYWSKVNINHLKRLTKLGLMHQSGLKVFEARNKEKSEKYSFERENVKLSPGYQKHLNQTEKHGTTFSQCRHPIKRLYYGG